MLSFLHRLLRCMHVSRFIGSFQFRVVHVPAEEVVGRLPFLIEMIPQTAHQNYYTHYIQPITLGNGDTSEATIALSQPFLSGIPSISHMFAFLIQPTCIVYRVISHYLVCFYQHGMEGMGMDMHGSRIGQDWQRYKDGCLSGVAAGQQPRHTS
ncbi:hypothetical protein K504DRAFT_213500 [Pleomassaria siparia CBS 279.74]|uniref:Uncharacterized protein n=1 Tax=Pleomassaria siparia CBS 279.74 TaxID=1314801 RepID=A0A6G1JQ12_9PLEO|nr:hypothetical protein K504DRAFT_213500 [Pleomassaria siparia CBS 279.74]